MTRSVEVRAQSRKRSEGKTGEMAAPSRHRGRTLPRVCGSCGARKDTRFADGGAYVFHRAGCALS